MVTELPYQCRVTTITLLSGALHDTMPGEGGIGRYMYVKSRGFV
jgi:hypothetical protein